MRSEVWDERASVAERILGAPVAWGHELAWQRGYRYQAWDEDLRQVDLTFDEEVPVASEIFYEGWQVVVDKASVRAHLETMAKPESTYDALTLRR
jgi:hypothetical protein